MKKNTNKPILKITFFYVYVHVLYIYNSFLSVSSDLCGLSYA